MKHVHPRYTTVCAWILWFGISGAVFAQSLPGSTIWLASVSHDGELGVPLRISRIEGYDNQPHFSPDGRIVYFTSESEGGQTDIRMNTLDGKHLGLVNSAPESDYSPTPIPGQHALSVVRVEPDSRQRLWRIDLETGLETLLLPEAEPVGYHEWISEEIVAMFILGETFDLFLGRLGHSESQRVTQNIGRTLRTHPKTGTLLFVDKNTAPWSIALMNPSTLEVREALGLFPGVEDFEVDSNGWFWTGDGSKLYVSKGESSSWRLAADLSEYGIQNITRLAASPDAGWLAIVSSP